MFSEFPIRKRVQTFWFWTINSGCEQKTAGWARGGKKKYGLVGCNLYVDLLDSQLGVMLPSQYGPCDCMPNNWISRDGRMDVTHSPQQFIHNELCLESIVYGPPGFRTRKSLFKSYPAVLTHGRCMACVRPSDPISGSKYIRKSFRMSAFLRLSWHRSRRTNLIHTNISSDRQGLAAHHRHEWMMLVLGMCVCGARWMASTLW